jgi:hypothetical protein
MIAPFYFFYFFHKQKNNHVQKGPFCTIYPQMAELDHL